MNPKIHENSKLALHLFPNGVPWIEREGMERCGYCGSLSPTYLHLAERVDLTDDPNKVYLIIDNTAYKFYLDHI